jgi:uncharacterized membrane protein
MMIPRERVVLLDIDVETAVKLLVSLGVVTPPGWQSPGVAVPLAPVPPAA